MKEEHSYLATIDTNIDRIIEYLQDDTGNVHLPHKLHELLDRTDYIDNLIREDLYWDKDIVPMIMKKFDVGRRTAYRLIKATKDIHRSKTHADKQYELDFMWHLAVKTFRLSLAAGNLKQMNTAISNLHRLWADRHQETNPYDELKPHTYVLMITQKDGTSQKINLGDMAESIPFEEMNQITDALNKDLEEQQLKALLEDNDSSPVTPK